MKELILKEIEKLNIQLSQNGMTINNRIKVTNLKQNYILALLEAKIDIE